MLDNKTVLNQLENIDKNDCNLDQLQLVELFIEYLKSLK